MEFCPQKIPGAQQLIIRQSAIVGPFRVHSVSNQPAGVAFQQLFGIGIVLIHNAQCAALEQFALPMAVFLKAAVLTGGNMIGVQIGEHRHIKVQTGHTVQHKALTAHFH